MKCCTKPQLSFQCFLETFPKLRGEPSVPIRYYRHRYTMQVYYLSDIQLSPPIHTISGFAWDEVSHFGKSVNNYPDYVEALLGLGYARDKMHTNCF